jgi:hypothetical protein
MGRPRSDEEESRREPVTVWRPSQQEHGTGEASRHDPWRGESWSVDADDRGLTASVEVNGFDSDDAAFLVQIAHRSRAGTRICRAIVTSGGTEHVHDVVARSPRRDWQREIVRFAAKRTRAVSIDVVAPGGTAFRVGLITLWRALRRPFWVISHMSNSPQFVRRDVARGANAIECDVWTDDGKPEGALSIHHGFVPPYPRRSAAKLPLRSFLEGLGSSKEQLALVVFDCPPLDEGGAADYRAYGARLAESIAPHLPASRCLISVMDPVMTSVFDGLRDAGFEAGRDISRIRPTGHEPDDVWIDAAESHGATAIGIGTDPFVPWDLLRTWFGPVAAAVTGRDGSRRVKKVYYWTVGSSRAMRKLLDFCIDGMIVNDPRTLRTVLAEPPYDILYRPATTADSQFEVHGPPAAAP